MFHVVADIERDSVERAVIRIRLLTAEEHIVFADGVTSRRVEPHRQKGAGDQVDQGFNAEKVKDSRVEGDLQGG